MPLTGLRLLVLQDLEVLRWHREPHAAAAVLVGRAAIQEHGHERSAGRCLARRRATRRLDKPRRRLADHTPHAPIILAELDVEAALVEPRQVVEPVQLDEASLSQQQPRGRRGLTAAAAAPTPLDGAHAADGQRLPPLPR